MTIVSRVQLARERAAALLQLLSLDKEESPPPNPLTPQDTYIVLGLTRQSGIKITSNEK